MEQHISKQYDAELNSIRNRVLQMGGMVELQIVKAMDGLASGDLALLEEVIKADHRINLLEIELDESCTQIIAKRQPAARDLRLVMTVIKMITDLERIGDEAKKIAKMSKRLHTSDTAFVPRVDMRHCANMAIEMLRRTLDSFAREDVSVAADTVRQDKAVDAAY